MNKTVKMIAIVLAIVLVFLCGFGLGQKKGLQLQIDGNNNVSIDTDATQANATQAPTEQSTELPTELPTEAPTELSTEPTTELTTNTLPTTTAPASPTTTANNGGAAPATTKAPAPSKAPTTTKAVEKTPSTKGEILALFTKSANKIKTNASKVTRNYEDLQHNEEKLEVPALLKSIGSGLINTFLKKDETPVDYVGKAAIIADYPVKGQNYVTAAKESDIKSATCTDDGKNYNVTLTFIDATDPTNTGVATSFNIIKAEEVYAAASVVKSFSATYYDAKIVCKIDKATGNMVSATYTLPIIMKVKAMGVDAQVGMTFIDDYTITY